MSPITYKGTENGFDNNAENLVDNNDVVVGHVNNVGDIIRHEREELPAYIQEQHDDCVTGERLNRFNNLKTKIKESESKF